MESAGTAHRRKRPKQASPTESRIIQTPITVGVIQRETNEAASKTEAYFPDPFFLARQPQATRRATSNGPRGLVLRKLAALLYDEKQFKNGDMRLFAWTADEIPGAHTDPAAPQVRRASLVVVHLQFAALPQPHPDANLRPLKDLPDEPFEPEPPSNPTLKE